MQFSRITDYRRAVATSAALDSGRAPGWRTVSYNSATLFSGTGLGETRKMVSGCPYRVEELADFELCCPTTSDWAEESTAGQSEYAAGLERAIALGWLDA